MYDFGLTSEEFWELTWAQYHALLACHDARILHEERGPAQVTHQIASLFRGEGKKKITVRDFMPHGKLIPEEPAAPKELKDQIKAAFRRPKNAAPKKGRAQARKRG